MPHETFHYRSLDELEQKARALSAFLPLDTDTSVLFEPLKLGSKTVPNRIVLQPMEGTDGETDGSPAFLTRRRYDRFAKGGAGLIWFEAVATLPRVRASAHQLMLTRGNLDAFKRLTDDIRGAALSASGHAPVIIMQATNSGRYSKPQGFPEPVIAYNCPPLEETPLRADRIITDDELKRCEDAYEETARLCAQAGFDGMDIKCCHRYLACELLSAYTRKGPYGGSFENRTRFLKNCYRAAKAGAGKSDFILTSRLNAYDGFEYPYGFGVRPGGGLTPDLSEAVRLINELTDEFGIPLINITMGNPYKNPHVNRPYDHGNYVPDEHPLVGVSRMMKGVSEIQAAVRVPVICSAFSYLRQFSPYLAAGMVKNGYAAMAGFGRMAFAYPDFVRELRENGAIEPNKCCVTCGGCAVKLRNGIPAGCVIRDREAYKA